MRSIRYVVRDIENKVTERGEMDLHDIGSVLRYQEEKAKKLMEDEHADHVVYGMRMYDKKDRPVLLQLLLYPMNECMFDTFSRHCRGAIVYALHRSK